MAKAVFLDYFGTVLQENGVDMQQMLSRVIANSSADDDKKLLAWWMKNLQSLERSARGENYITEEEISLKLLLMAPFLAVALALPWGGAGVTLLWSLKMIVYPGKRD